MISEEKNRINAYKSYNEILKLSLYDKIALTEKIKRQQHFLLQSVLKYCDGVSYNTSEKLISIIQLIWVYYDIYYFLNKTQLTEELLLKMQQRNYQKFISFQNAGKEDYSELLADFNQHELYYYAAKIIMKLDESFDFQFTISMYVKSIIDAFEEMYSRRNF